MRGWRSVLILSAAAMVAGATSALAQKLEDFVGTHMAIGDPLGYVVGHVEELTVSPSGDATVRLYRLPSFDDEKCQAPSAERPPACANSVVTRRGRLVVGPGPMLAIMSDTAVGESFPERRDADLYAAGFGFASGVPHRVIKRREGFWAVADATAEGEPVRVLRRFVTVPEGFASDWFDLVIDNSVSLLRSGCVLDALMDDPEGLAAHRRRARSIVAISAALFRARQAADAEVEHARRVGGDVAAAEERAVRAAERVIRFLEAPVDSAPSLAADLGVPAEDLAVALAQRDWLAADGDRFEFLTPEGLRHRTRIEACWATLR